MGGEGGRSRVGGLGLGEVTGDRSAPPRAKASLYTSAREVGAAWQRRDCKRRSAHAEGGDWIVGGSLAEGWPWSGTVSMAWCGNLKRWQGGSKEGALGPLLF